MKTRFVVLPLVLGAFAYSQSAGTFSATGNMTTSDVSSSTLLANGKVLILGAGVSAQLYDPGTGAFMATGDRTAPGFHTATLLPNGKVLIAGSGFTNADGSGYTSLRHAELYDPDTGTFTATGDMTVERSTGHATLLNNGKVLIAGGAVLVGGLLGRTLASAELYDPSRGTFSATGSMNETGCDTATLLPNGQVLITRSIVYDPPDGSGSENFVRHAELYDPTTGTFAFTGDMTAGHTASTATLLANGKVLVAGGDIGDGDLASRIAELYDPATGTFSATGHMTVGREEDTATLLPDGTVLLAGGHILENASAELYDPVTGAFSRAGDMAAGRELHTATLLPSGQVLIAGGYGSPANLSTAEIYTPSVSIPSPVLRSLSGDGRGQGAIWHSATGQVALASNPAVAGEVLSMYTTSLVDGGVVPPQVAIGGRLAEVVYFGASAYPGYNQVNFRVPGGVARGPAVPVRLTYLGRPSNEVTIGVQ